MTDPRIVEIERRLALDEHEGSLRHFHGKVRADLRYLLSLVAEQDQRIKELEAAGNEAARNHLSRVKSSEPLSAEDYRRLGIEAYDILQRVLLPAPETVEPAP